MVSAAADLATLGRRIAMAQGYDPHDPSVDWAAYGREAQYRIGRRQGVPDPSRFRRPPSLDGGGAPSRSTAPATGAPSLSRSVRIGAFQMSIVEPAEARHRPRHHRHAGERTTGRARRRAVASAPLHHHRHVTARGAHEVARITSRTGATYLLRSDGVILRKSGVAGDSWTREWKLREGVPLTFTTLERILARRNLLPGMARLRVWPFHRKPKRQPAHRRSASGGLRWGMNPQDDSRYTYDRQGRPWVARKMQDGFVWLWGPDGRPLGPYISLQAARMVVVRASTR